MVGLPAAILATLQLNPVMNVLLAFPAAFIAVVRPSGAPSLFHALTVGPAFDRSRLVELSAVCPTFRQELPQFCQFHAVGLLFPEAHCLILVAA